MLDRRFWHYKPSVGADSLVLAWWARLVDLGQRDLVAGEAETDTPSDFLAFWRHPRALAFCPLGPELKDGIWFAAWVEPLLSGVFVGLWIDPRYRTTKAAAFCSWRFLDLVTQTWPVAIGLTKQPQLMKVHKMAGFTYLGELPHLFDGNSGHVMVLTREGFENGWKRRAVRRGGNLGELCQLPSGGGTGSTSGDSASGECGTEHGPSFWGQRD